MRDWCTKQWPSPSSLSWVASGKQADFSGLWNSYCEEWATSSLWSSAVSCPGHLPSLPVPWICSVFPKRYIVIERYFCSRMAQLTCFVHKILAAGPSIGKQSLLLGLGGKIVVFSCHCNLVAVEMCLWQEYLPCSNFTETTSYHWYLQGGNIN